MDVSDLVDRAVAAPIDSAERILFGAAAFNALITGEVVLVGGGAQATHTGVGRITDIDVVGPVTKGDEERLRDFGFQRRGRHWVFDRGGETLAIEVPSATLAGDEEPELIDLGGVTVAVIAVNDLMMDRVLQATDGTAVTRDEALSLAIAAHDRIDWDKLEERADRVARRESLLRRLPALVAELRDAAN